MYTEIVPGEPIYGYYNIDGPSDLLTGEEFIKHDQRFESGDAGHRSFYWLYYRPCQPLFADLSDKAVSLLVLYAAYMRNHKVCFCSRAPTNIAVLMKEYGLSEEILKQWIDGRYVFIEKNDTLSLNGTIFSVGKKTKGTCGMKIDRDGVLKLFRENKMYSATVAIFFRLIPYVHYKSNVVCHIPNHPNEEKCKPMTIADINRILGLSRTERNTTERLFAPKIGVCRLCSKVNDRFIINPALYYGGDRWTITYLSGDFDNPERVLVVPRIKEFLRVIDRNWSGKKLWMEDRKPIVDAARYYCFLQEYNTDYTFNAVVKVLSEVFGYSVITGRGMHNGKKSTYKLIGKLRGNETDQQH